MAALPPLPRSKLHGRAVVPMVTPVTTTGEVDLAAAANVANHIVTGGCTALLLAGTNGEGASLAPRARIALTSAVAKVIAGRALVFAGIGHDALSEAILMGRACLEAGADAVVAHPPSYFADVSSVEIEAWYTRLADGVAGPLFIYNMPKTTNISIPIEVIQRLSKHRHIVGVKDSEGVPDRQKALAESFVGRTDFAVYCGSTAATKVAMLAGADGTVPSLGNVCPAPCAALVDLCSKAAQGVAGKEAEAAEAQRRCDALGKAVTAGAGTIPRCIAMLKAGVMLLGLAPRWTLPPIAPASDEEVNAVRDALIAEAVLNPLATAGVVDTKDGGVPAPPAPASMMPATMAAVAAQNAAELQMESLLAAGRLAGAAGALRRVSQQFFDDVVKENVEELDMTLEEARQDAVDTLKKQRVDLTGIDTGLVGVDA